MTQPDPTIDTPDPNVDGPAPLIGFIVSSTRQGRVGRQLTDEIVRLAATRSAARLEVVDLREVGLPFADEPRPPATGEYHHETTKDWARRVDTLDAVVIVTAEYNGGYPAPLKNALDTVYGSWNGKPVLVVSYGGHGGKRAAAALDPVLQTLKMKKVEPSVSITLTKDDYGPNGPLTGPLANVCAVVERHRAELEVGFAALHSELGC